MAINTQFPVVALLRILQENNTREAWIDYDAEADVLYVNFQRPVAAEHAEMDENDTVLRYSDSKLVGFTILNASTRTGASL